MVNYKEIPISLIALLLTIFYLTYIGITEEREKQKAIVILNQKIEQRDRTIKILRDSLALDSVLVIIGGRAKIKSDSTGDSVIVSFGDANLRQWKKK